MGEKSITEIVSEFSEESRQVAQKSQEIKSVSAEIKESIISEFFVNNIMFLREMRNIKNNI